MTDQSVQRLRPHPQERFAGSNHLIDLNQAAEKLIEESRVEPRRLRRQTLHHSGPVTVALFVLEQGATIPEHVANGVVTIHVLAGQVAIAAQGDRHVLRGGNMLVLDPGVKHDVEAIEASRMLLTVCLDKK